MSAFAIVIVAKDAAHKLDRLLHSLKDLCSEVWVCDTGSSDNTIAVAQSHGVHVHQMPWEGYGTTKHKASMLPYNDWILSLDSDEELSAELYQALKAWQPGNHQIVYQILWKNYLGDTWIKHSDWGSSWKNRLFNRKAVNWNFAVAHEDLESEAPITYQKLNGFLNHYSFLDTRDYAIKMMHSATLIAQQYHQKGRQSSIAHILINPPINFIKCYLLKLGFLDGFNGWLIAKTSAHYTFIKYSYLRELNKHKVKD